MSAKKKTNSQTLVSTIRRYNRWRRGDEKIVMPCPARTGKALDAICDLIDGHAGELLGWKNKWECAVEMAAQAQADRDEWRERLLTFLPENSISPKPDSEQP